jgi:hypothetical protein
MELRTKCNGYILFFQSFFFLLVKYRFPSFSRFIIHATSTRMTFAYRIFSAMLFVLVCWFVYSRTSNFFSYLAAVTITGNWAALQI